MVIGLIVVIQGTEYNIDFDKFKYISLHMISQFLKSLNCSVASTFILSDIFIQSIQKHFFASPDYDLF